MSARITTLCTVLGVVIGLVSLYLPYRAELKNALYEEKFLTGKWSTDAEYVINSADIGLNKPQPIITIQLEVTDDGSVDGEIISEGLCDAMPLTWNIMLTSDTPSIYNFIIDRKFEVRQLVNGSMLKSPVMAKLKLTSKDHKNKSLTFDVISDATGSLPKQLTVAKDLPKFEENYNYLQNYCAESTQKFHKRLNAERKKSDDGKHIMENINNED